MHDHVTLLMMLGIIIRVHFSPVSLSVAVVCCGGKESSE